MSSDTAPPSGRATLTLGALGVVFGDIGTSPLYSLQTVFSIDHNEVKPTPSDVYGVISLVFWSITLIVSIKYVVFILRADNDGEGGILSLAHLARRFVPVGGRRYALVMVLGVIGASLFYGDSLITPAISVLSAVEGVEVAAPSFSPVVLPVGVVIITLLFAGQRFGTELVGRFFGPIMVVWFLVLAALGVSHIVRNPGVIQALSPHHAVAFLFDHVYISFVAMGAVVLVITGAEALYADMGHFGRGPIQTAWFALVFPALTLNYLGQAQVILQTPAEAANPFFHMAPGWAQVPLVVLATAATVIASQAVISGAYSVSRQAERLGYLPRMTVRQTSRRHGGQIYIRSVNWLLFGGVLILMLVFRSSDRLATAYGLAVTATLLLTTTLFCVYAQAALGWNRWRLAAFGLVFGTIEGIFFAANLTKILHGGWLPLLIAISIATVMLTWRRGVTVITERRLKLEGPLMPYLGSAEVRKARRVPGTAVFLHTSKDTVPLALRENVAFNHALHKHVVIVTTRSHNVPHIPAQRRVEVDRLGETDDRIDHVTLNFGFSDAIDVPAGLAIAVKKHKLDLDVSKAAYFVSRITLEISDRPGMAKWRKRIVLGLAHNAAKPTEYFNLPVARTVIMGAQVRF